MFHKQVFQVSKYRQLYTHPLVIVVIVLFMSPTDSMGYTLIKRPEEVRKSSVFEMLVYVLHAVYALYGC